MKKFEFNVVCLATYTTSLLVPSELETEDEILKYINEHINDTEIESPIEYLEDSDTEVISEDVNWDYTVHYPSEPSVEDHEMDV